MQALNSAPCVIGIQPRADVRLAVARHRLGGRRVADDVAVLGRDHGILAVGDAEGEDANQRER